MIVQGYGVTGRIIMLQKEQKKMEKLFSLFIYEEKKGIQQDKKKKFILGGQTNNIFKQRRNKI